MKSSNKHCPLLTNGLSFDAGLKRRLCCHEDSFERIPITDQDKLNNKHLNEDLSKHCQSCFSLEEKTGHSPRKEYLSKITSEDDKIHYLDVTFDSLCNLACISCFPQYSHKVAQHFDQLMINYDKESCLSSDEFALRLNEIKTYLLENLSSDSLIVLTGGEPAINKNIHSFLDWLRNNFDSSQMTIRIFSNFTIDFNWLMPFTSSFKHIELIASIDASGEACRYIRYPSEWPTISKYLNQYLNMMKSNQSLKLSIHSVVSNLSICHLNQLILDLQLIENGEQTIPHFTLLRSPAIYAPENIKKEYLQAEIEKLQATYKKLPFSRLKNLIDLLSGINFKYDPIPLYLHLKKLDTLRNTDHRQADIVI